MRIAGVQCVCPSGANAVSDAVAVLRESMAECAKQGIDLVVFPELFLGGYCAGDLFASIAQDPQTSTALQEVSTICKSTGTACLIGFVERPSSSSGEDSTKLYNSAALFGKDGCVLSVYRKCHIWSSYEKKYFSAGNQLDNVVEYCGVRLGILICYDVEFPESVRTLALAGANLILVPTALANPYNAQATISSRSFENHVFIAYINFVGTNGQVTFCGRSVICGPDGLDIWRASPADPSIGSAIIDRTKKAYVENRARNPYIEDRRPDLYHSLVAPCHHINKE
eukprot:ANDGO_05309.mRNA.1 Hydrolase in pqqF 5'region